MKEFQSFRLDTANHCLWRADSRVSLTPKAFDVLRYLVENAGRVVTQGEILESVWPDTYVNPEVIKKYILGIRKVLGDQSDQPLFIETFPKRGYQFVAPVSDASTAGSSDLPSDSKMVGRDMALASLNSHLDRALRGRRQLMFVTGEAGIGKTMLVDMFHQQAARRPNLRVARGQCVEGFGGKEAYYPMLEALGQLIRDSDSNPVAQTLAKGAPTWWIQFPSLVKAEKREALQREILGATRERMVREICETLEAITADHPLVLIFEDLHWVDDSTLDLISALARRREPARLMLLGTYRPTDVVLSKTPLKGLKQDLQVHRLCTEIALERLEEPAIAEYLATEFPNASLPLGLTKLIHRHSGGNPLFMVAIVQDIVEKGLVAEHHGRWRLTQPLEDVVPGVPETLQQMLDVQFDQLSSAQQRLLKVASVAGERFSVWAITTALEIEPNQIEDICEGLAEKQQFLKASGIYELANGEFSAHYEFRHSLYRQAIYKRLSDGSRSKLHRVVGERLRALCIPGRQESASEVALHLEQGYEYEQAIHYLVLAAENAAKRFAYQEAIQVLRQALRLIPRVPSSVGTSLEIKILQLIGDAHCALGNLPEAAQSYETEAAWAARVGLKGAQVNALCGLARAAAFFDGDRGIAVCEEAVQVITNQHEPLLLASTQLLAASFRLLYDGWRKEDAELCASADEAICNLSEAGLPAYHEMMYCHIQSLQGNYQRAIEMAEAGTPRVAEAASLMVYLAALSGKVFARLHLGQFGEALRIIVSGKEMAEKNENDPWLAIFRALESWLRTLAFDFQGAVQLTKVILGTNTEHLEQAPRLLAMVFGSYAEFGLGKKEKALHSLDGVRKQKTTAKVFLGWYWRMHAQLGLSNVWLEAGNFANARVAADSFLECALSTADPNMQALAWEMKTRVAMAENDWTLAGDSIQAALAVLEEREVPLSAWRVYATAWEFYRLQKNDQLAERHRAEAEAGIQALADSFPEQEPLRAIFLAADPVPRILGGAVGGQMDVAREAEKVG